MQNYSNLSCPDCDGELSRREFVRTLGGAAVAAGLVPAFVPQFAKAAPKPTSPAETAVKRFYDTLSATQREAICFPFNDERGKRISANWHVTKPTIGSDFYTVEQRKLIEEVLRGVTSEDGYERFQKQMEYDDGGMNFYSVAVLGEPGGEKFQWMMTGRHLTIRADGNTVDNAAFGGPIVYGHGESDPKDNLYHYQTKRANDVFAALDPKQRDKALVDNAPRESAVLLQGESGQFPGIPVGELSADQKQLVEDVVKVILAPYRQEDVEEALAYLKAGGGFDKLRLAFYKQGDLTNDQVWDIWRVEGPTFVWHFRGAPHVHTYVNIGQKA
jgi:hypothetical protein